MTEEKEIRVPKMELDAMMGLLARPPVLSTESLERFLALRDQFVLSLKPRDFLELRLVMEVVDAAWKIQRCTFHQTLGIERWYQKSQEFQARRQKLRQARKESLAQHQAETIAQTPSDIAGVVRLEEKFVDTISEVDHAVTWTAEEIGHNDAFERSMPFQESLEKLLAIETRRFYQAMEALEHHRQVFGSRVSEKVEQAPNKVEQPGREPAKNLDDCDFVEFLDDVPPQSIVANSQRRNTPRKGARSHATR